jgi:hypothetical protein
VRRCSCVGGGGSGGGSEENKSGQGETKVSASTLNQAIVTSEQIGAVALPTIDSKGSNTQSQSSDRIFNPDVIKELLSNKVLSIKNDRDNGQFTIKIDPSEWCKLPSEHKEELQKFINAIVHEFKEFKNQLDPSDQKKCYYTAQDDQGGIIEKDDQRPILSLNIRIASPKLYDAFIAKLNKNENIKNVLQCAEQLEKNVDQKDMRISDSTSSKEKMPNKIPTQATHESNQPDKQKPDKEEKYSSRIRSPLSTDGPKPKGFK